MRILPILIIAFFAGCGTVEKIGETAIEEYNFYRKAKEEAKAREIADLVKEELEETPPPEPEDFAEHTEPPDDEKNCKFSFFKLRRIL